MTSSISDEPTTTIAAGATVTALVNTVGDVDLFNINLVAGQTYSFSLSGSGLNPLIDPILSLTKAGVVVASDDDGGIGIDSLLTFTATQSGTYQISAAAYPDSGLIGEYTLAVRQMGADSVGSLISSSVAMAVGSLTYGFIETPSDTDMYKVTLVEGLYYSFNVAGGTDYNTPVGSLEPGELDTTITVYDPHGTQVAFNHDLSPEDSSSGVGFIATQSGTYYVAVSGGSYTGGYTLQVDETDLSAISLLDTIDWGTQLASNTVTVYFATIHQTFDGVRSLGWTAYEIEQAMEALQTYADVAGLTISRTTDASTATFRLVTTESEEFLGYFNPPGETNAGIGVFATNNAAWNTTGGLEPGGAAFATLVHEFGHGLGLAHPHDNGGGSPPMPGVFSPFDSYGVFDLNQGVYTTMSYNDGWMLHPSGSGSGFVSYGFQAGPGALDIALIQLKYGARSSNTGDNVYTLSTGNGAGTFWDVIWDTGGTDTIAATGTVTAYIDLTAATLDYSATGGGVISYVAGVFGGYTIAAGVVIENATGGGADDIIIGNGADNVLSGGGGSDTMFGRAGADTFRGTSAELNGDRIGDLTAGDRIVITDATLASFTYSLTGYILNFSGGTLYLTDGNTFEVAGHLVASVAPEGGVQLTLSNTLPPPPPPASRAKLILTQSGQDMVIGGNVAVLGTTAGGEVIEIVRGNVTLDASFNAGGDTVVLPGNAGTYSAVLSGSLVVISGAGTSVAIPVGTAGIAVQFADSTRTLEIQGGQVVLGTQQITSSAQPVAASGAPLVDAVESGPDSFAKLILTAPGQDVDVGGNVSVTGTTAPSEVVTVLGGNIRLDASFNAGGDTVVMPGASSDYAASLSGSLVTITDGHGTSVAIPVGVNGITVDFTNVDLTLRVDTATGTVRLGDQVITASSGTVQSAQAIHTSKDSELSMADLDGLTLADLDDGGDGLFAGAPVTVELSFNPEIELHRFEFNDSFSFA